MDRFLSVLFGLASAVLFLGIFTALFVVQARWFTASLFWASAVGGPLFAISVFFDRRDARRHHLPPTKFLPSRRGFFSFLMALYLISMGLIFLGVIVYAVMRLPAGDTWEAAWIRLLFVLASVAFAVQFRNVVVVVGRRLFDGQVYDDWLDSIGTPTSGSESLRRLSGGLSLTDQIVLLSVGVFGLVGGMQWLAPIANWPAAGRRGRKVRWFLTWCVDHPNTITLFSTFACVVSITWLAWHLTHGDGEEESPASIQQK